MKKSVIEKAKEIIQSQMLPSTYNTKLNLFRYDYKQRFTYASDIWDLLKDVIKASDILFLYGQKNSGKSTIG